MHICTLWRMGDPLTNERLEGCPAIMRQETREGSVLEFTAFHQQDACEFVRMRSEVKLSIQLDLDITQSRHQRPDASQEGRLLLSD